MELFFGNRQYRAKNQRFSKFMKEYQSIVTKSTYKSPDVQKYPLIRKETKEGRKGRKETRQAKTEPKGQTCGPRASHL